MLSYCKVLRHLSIKKTEKLTKEFDITIKNKVCSYYAQWVVSLITFH